MTTYYLMPSGKLPVQDGKLVRISQQQFECCCCHPTEITQNEFGLLEGNTGWYGLEYNEDTKIFSGQFIYEDAEDAENFDWEPGEVRCEGNNSNVQHGTAFLWVCFDHDVVVEANVNGNVETFMDHYDYGRVKVGNTILAEIRSTKNDKFGCVMEAASDDGTSEVIEAFTPFTMGFEADTGDKNWHKDMVHNFEAKVVPYIP